ncbi:FecCD family ABC transporter permease [Dyella tabacisoli]|uniref:Iron ABC transporter permease n=1 Tax=Dyella tabacisoli TaxID=2282381 RepID=A0A369URR8_9GAMM|nr:iron ABC transporter permease [Dyella tabacisoli]RDD82320.1 iron ABC transporter permease [Dyella tabacisoli]
MALPRSRARPGKPLAFGGLAVLLAAVALWSLSCGAMNIPLSEVLGALGRWLSGSELSGDDHVVLMLRLPRVLLAMLVGAALACSGAAMQGLFRNPLADPGLIGVSAGAALGAVTMIVLGGAFTGVMSELAGSFGIAGAAFAGGLAATALVYMLGRRRPGIGALLLAGVAISAIAMAGVGLLTFLASENQLRDLTFWSLGSLGGASWQRLAVISLPMLLALLLLPRSAAALNALLLGEQEACLLGFRPERLKPLLVTLVALSVSAAVATTGVIGFVGLVVPHLLRMLWGSDHRMLLPGSILGGAVLLTAADTFSRTVVAPAELPIGVLTALLGGPFFLWLLLRARIGEVQS